MPDAGAQLTHGLDGRPQAVKARAYLKQGSASRRGSSWSATTASGLHAQLTSDEADELELRDGDIVYVRTRTSRHF
jgi:hypothetical protein